MGKNTTKNFENTNMNRLDIWQAINKLDRLVFTTREIAQVTESSLSSTTQRLVRLEEKKIVKKIVKGVWALIYDKRFSPFMIIPFLSPSHQSYVSFISALHLYGIISQIPQTITIASTAHSKKITTPIGTYIIHQLEPSFFVGFNWHESGHFLIATPEKALVDCVYISTRKKNVYSSFPELEFPKNFSKKEVVKYIGLIKDKNSRHAVRKKMETIL